MGENPVPEVAGFTVERFLGQGSSASVWLVTDDSTRRRYALKWFAQPPFEDGFQIDGTNRTSTADTCDSVSTATQQELLREVRIHSVLQHPHLVRSHNVITAGVGHNGEGGSPALLLDYAPGGSLSDLVLGRGPLSVGETVTVLTPVAQALAYLHSHGITHSDVSPGNILFMADGRPLLADVGIAHRVGDPVAENAQGTLGFADPAPQDVIRAGLQPERDVYALAAVGWFCLTGRVPPPISGRMPLPVSDPRVPSALAAALEAGLAPDRRARPTAAEFATAIYRSAEPTSLSLAGVVHATVAPELLTRRSVTPGEPGPLTVVLRSWRRFFRSSTWMVGHTAGASHVPAPRRTSRRTVRARRTPRHVHDQSRRRRRREAPPMLRRAWVIVSAAACLVVASVACLAAFPEQMGVYSPDREPPSAAVASVAATPGPDHPGIPAHDVGQASGSTHLARPPGVPGPAATTVPAGLDQGAVVPGIPARVQDLMRSDDPLQAIQGLAWVRSEALRTGQMALLNRVNAQGSPAEAADLRLAAELRAKGIILDGFSMVLEAMTQVESPCGFCIDLHAGNSAYRELSGSAVVSEHAASATSNLRIVLVRPENEWRISEILGLP